MRHLGLFEGIGGFSLAARWMGWETLAWCEIDPFCQTVLKHHFPNAIGYGDIKSTDFSPWNGTIDILTGGFPCQPFSQAGKRRGAEDERHLWPEMLRAIREIQPSYIVAENVYGLLNQGRGMVFESVCSQMEDAGYEVQPIIIPACAINAQIRRDRIWIIGRISNTHGIGCEGDKIPKKRQQHRGGGQTQRLIDPLYSISKSECKRGESTFNTGVDGIPRELDQLRANGNAIVPQVAFEIFKAIQNTFQ